MFSNKFIQRKSFAFTSVRSSMIHSASFYSSDSSLTDDDEPILHISDDGTGFIKALATIDWVIIFVKFKSARSFSCQFHFKSRFSSQMICESGSELTAGVTSLELNE